MNVIPYSRFQEYQDRRQIIRDRILVDMKENAARAAQVDRSTSPQEKKKK